MTTSDGQAVEFVNVGLKGTAKGSVTDKDGNFEIKNIHPGTYTAFASLVGSARQEQVVEIKSGEITKFDFMLSETAVELSEITVVGDRINKFYFDSSFIVS